MFIGTLGDHSPHRIDAWTVFGWCSDDVRVRPVCERPMAASLYD
jgi:hypothetical protein